jgi:hypothetical protein
MYDVGILFIDFECRYQFVDCFIREKLCLNTQFSVVTLAVPQHTHGGAGGEDA